MAGEEKRSKSETVRLWTEAVGIPIALAGLGLLQFWLKEVRWPEEVPVNLTADLSVKDAGFSSPGFEQQAGSEPQLEAVELEVTARNPSSRPIYLLNNLWIAYGVKIGAPNNGTWMEDTEKQLNGDHQIVGGKHYRPQHPVPVAAGNIFTDNSLQPSEKIVRSFVFYVPRGTYDYIEVDIGLPTITSEMQGHPEQAAAGVEYELRKDQSSYLPSVYLFNADGTHKTDVKDGELKSLGFQWALATRMLSLWQVNAPTPSKDSTTPNP
jgi:hypothetical protein